MVSRRFVSFALIVVAAVPIASYADATPDGAVIYKANCAICHGADGSGQTPAGKAMKVRDLRAPDVQKKSDAELMRTIADGNGKMPAYKAKLGSDEIQALVTLIRRFAN